MESDKIKKFLRRRSVKNLLLAVVLFFGIIFALKIALSVITRHGKELVVPDLTNITVQQADSLAESMGLNLIVGDSVYIRRLGRGLIYSQNPPAGGKVKKGRKIMVIINSVAPKKVRMPNLVGYSLRQAKAELSTRGLALGRLTYVKDIATNNVLKQTYRGLEIETGTMIETLSKIDLEIGLNPGENTTFIPDVAGLKYLRAVDLVQESSLNIAGLMFDSTVKSYSDSLDAVVYRQSPIALIEEEPADPELGTEAVYKPVPAKMGDGVTLYLSLDPAKYGKKR